MVFDKRFPIFHRRIGYYFQTTKQLHFPDSAIIIFKSIITKFKQGPERSRRGYGQTSSARPNDVQSGGESRSQWTSDQTLSGVEMFTSMALEIRRITREAPSVYCILHMVM